jgi:RNA polymerase sigma-70 factor, ECF subfamily
MFVCTHPAIDPAMRAPLMMQTVLGLDAARIASAFLVPPGTMGVGLSRAKAKIAVAGVPFALPEPPDLATRLTDVLDAVYAAYTLGQGTRVGEDAGPADLTVEALWLISLICRLVPQSDEAHGLFALILFGLARRPACVDALGQYVPLGEQDQALWDQRLLADADRALRNARRGGTLGRFQIEAAIEALHVDGARKGQTDWQSIVLLYNGLATIAPTLGATCGGIAALANVQGAAAGLAVLDTLTAPRLTSYQPYWALRAHLLRQLGDRDAAKQAYLTAAALTQDESVRRWLMAQSRN